MEYHCSGNSGESRALLGFLTGSTSRESEQPLGDREGQGSLAAHGVSESQTQPRD